MLLVDLFLGFVNSSAWWSTDCSVAECFLLTLNAVSFSKSGGDGCSDKRMLKRSPIVTFSKLIKNNETWSKNVPDSEKRRQVLVEKLSWKIIFKCFTSCSH